MDNYLSFILNKFKKVTSITFSNANHHNKQTHSFLCLKPNQINLSNMKNLKKFAISRTGIVSVISIGVILFSTATIENNTKEVAFEVLQSKITISSCISPDKWMLQSGSISSTGSFELKEDALLNISNLSFTIPVSQLKSTNHELELALQNIFRQSNCNTIQFKQSHVMILPIMKMAQVIGNFSMANGQHSLPMQLHYELNDGQSLRIWGKQVVSLSGFGINVPLYETERIGDEMELTIDFVLVNKQEEPSRLFGNLIGEK